MGDEATKYDQEKPRLELLPPSYWPKTTASKLLAQWFYGEQVFLSQSWLNWDPLPALTLGAQKYGDFNWVKGMKWSRLVGAYLRHYNKYHNGFWVPRDLNEIDAESGLAHGHHAACNWYFLKSYFEWGIGEDDRPK